MMLHPYLWCFFGEGIIIIGEREIVDYNGKIELIVFNLLLLRYLFIYLYLCPLIEQSLFCYMLDYEHYQS